MCKRRTVNKLTGASCQMIQMNSQGSFRMMRPYHKGLSLSTLAPIAIQWTPTSSKAPSEGRGILVQDQQDPSAQLDGTIERRLPGVVANLFLQLMLVVGVGAHPVGRLIGQLTQRSVTLQARHELAHRLQPSMGHKPQQPHLKSLEL